MEKPANDTSVGVFDVVAPLYDQHPADTSQEVIVTVQGVDILKDELPGWLFFKKSTDPRIRDAVSYAETKARSFQSQTSTLDEDHDTEEHITRSMEYFALGLLSRHWAHRNALREAYASYRQQDNNRVYEEEYILEDHFG